MSFADTYSGSSARGHSARLVERCEELARRAAERFERDAVTQITGDNPQVIEEVLEFGIPIVLATKELVTVSHSVPEVVEHLGKVGFAVRAAWFLVLLIIGSIFAIGLAEVYVHGVSESFGAVRGHFVRIATTQDPYQMTQAIMEIFLLLIAAIWSVFKLNDRDELRKLDAVKNDLLWLSDEVDTLTVTLKAERLERPEDLNTQSSPRLGVPPIFVEAFLRYAHEIQRYLRAWCGVLMIEVSSESAREILDDIRKGCISSAADIDRQRSRTRDVREQAHNISLSRGPESPHTESQY